MSTVDLVQFAKTVQSGLEATVPPGFDGTFCINNTIYYVKINGPTCVGTNIMACSKRYALLNVTLEMLYNGMHAEGYRVASAFLSGPVV